MPSLAVRAKIYRPTDRNLTFLARKLREGELVAVPTETVYGLAADALDAKACLKIFHAKRRPTTDPLIVHLHSVGQLPLVCIPNPAAMRLAAAFWPGPLTIVLPKKAVVPDVITAGRDSVAVRIPSHRVFRKLLRAVQRPLAAPSANPFGYISPTSAEHVRSNLGPRIKHILDGGVCSIGLESTIVDLRDSTRPRLLRPGAISAAQLETVLDCPVAVVRKKPRVHRMGMIAPGLLSRHYSPRTPVKIHRKLQVTPKAGEAFLYIRKPVHHRGEGVYWLDRDGNLRRAARRLFAKLREIDSHGFRVIHAELAMGDEGFAAAINDRLTRAAAK